jgi:hypothetical protein
MCGAMPAPATRAVAVEDRAKLALDPIFDPFEKTTTCENLHEMNLDA